MPPGSHLHQDAFIDNFVVQWHPESLAAKKISVSRPRVYLIDFEVAIQFPEDCSPEERVCVGPPLGGSFPSPEMYNRQVPPEVESGKPYDPFKLDVWQLASSLHEFKVLRTLSLAYSRLHHRVLEQNPGYRRYSDSND